MRNTETYLKGIEARSGFRGRLLRRLFGSMLAGFRAADLDLEQNAEQQNAAMQALTQTMAQTQQQLAQLQQAQEIMAQQLSQLQQDIAGDGALRRELDTLSVNIRNNNAHIEALQSDSELCKVKLMGMERRLHNAASVVSTESAPVQNAAAPAAESDYDAVDYFDFENHFRGSIEHIKEAQRIYLPYFRGKQTVLDIGCGRGEFLSLLKDEGIPAEGVDVYEPYADYCTMQGLKASCGDGIAYLSKLAGVDGIFVGQVVEHLKTEQIISLCNTAYEKLTEGGCIIIETPNPTSLAIYTGAFYIDPSHVKPVHPLTMQYFLEKAGFRDIRILYPEGSRPPVKIPVLESADAQFNEAMQKVSDILFGSQDYAVIAVK